MCRLWIIVWLYAGLADGCLAQQAPKSKSLTGELIYQTVFTPSPGRLQQWADTVLFRSGVSIVKTGMPGSDRHNQIVCYKNLTTKRLISRELADGEPIIVQDRIAPIPWRFKNTYRTVGNYRCQAAIATVRGRTYTAWFTRQIPVSSGPWKLYGLPGLILEAEDKTGAVKFVFNRVSMSLPAQVVIKAPIPMGNQKQMTELQRKAYVRQKYEAVRQKLSSKPGLTNVRVEITPDQTIDID